VGINNEKMKKLSEDAIMTIVFLGVMLIIAAFSIIVQALTL